MPVVSSKNSLFEKPPPYTTIGMVSGFYVVEVVYTRLEKQAEVKKEYIAGIDLGVNNLVALRFITPGRKLFLSGKV